MDENEGGGPYSERRAQDFPRMHERSRLGARRDQGVHQVVILRIQEDDPEVLLVVIGRSEKVSSEQGDRFR